MVTENKLDEYKPSPLPHKYPVGAHVCKVVGSDVGIVDGSMCYEVGGERGWGLTGEHTERQNETERHGHH